MSYQTPKNVRREARALTGRFRSGVLAPVMAVPVRGNEGGLLSQEVTFELDPIMGRMITPIVMETVSVFVPVQAIDAIKAPNADYAGMTEVIREKLLSGNPLFTLEPEGEISKRCGVEPRMVGSVASVNQMVRLAHNAAVNLLRQQKYVKATTILHSNTAITPAILTETVLEKMRGVLDPDDHINGSVQLNLPNVNLPVKGITRTATNTELSGDTTQLQNVTGGTSIGNKGLNNFLKFDVTSAQNNIFAELNGVAAGGVSLSDFYNAEKMDQLTRKMREIVDANPQYGEEYVLNWAHGLNIDTGKIPMVVARRSAVFGRSMMEATDQTGVEADVRRSDMMLALNWTVPIPRTELGGIIITFCTLKPDETLAHQPHPILSDVWGLDNFVADELALDPEPVTFRELDSRAAAGQQATIAMYTGKNELKRAYMHYGLSRQLDPTTVANKTAIWQLEIPASVTPDNILYPVNFPQYPFADQLAEVCTYTISSNLTMQTPMIFGPTPVEELAIIDSGDIFDQDA